MSIIGQKLDAITQLKVTTSLGDGLLTNNTQVNNIRNSGGLKSLNPKNKDVVEYIVDLMSLLFGPEFLQKSVKGVMKKVFNRDNNGKMVIEEQFKRQLLGALCGNDGDQPLPEDFVITGYPVPVKSLDLFDLFKLNPTDIASGKVVGNENSFERNFLSNVLQATTTQNTPLTFDSLPNIGFAYTISANVVTMTADTDLPNTTTIESFFRTILYAPGFKLFNPEAIAMETLDVVLGYMSAKRTARALANEELLRDIVDKIGNEEPTETVYTFNAKSLEDVYQRAVLRKAGGYTLDLGCNITNVSVSEEVITNQVENQNDFSTMFTSALTAQLDADAIPLTDPIRQNFQRNLLKALVLVLLKHTILSPRIWTLFILSRIFQVGYPKSKYTEQISTGINRVDIHEILKGRQDLVTNLTKSVRKTVIEYLSQYLIKEIMKRIVPLQAQMAKEQLEAYTKILASFVIKK